MSNISANDTAQAIVTAMKAVVDGDVSAVIESLNVMTKSLQTIMDSMETLKSLLLTLHRFRFATFLVIIASASTHRALRLSNTQNLSMRLNPCELWNNYKDLSPKTSIIEIADWLLGICIGGGGGSREPSSNTWYQGVSPVLIQPVIICKK